MVAVDHDDLRGGGFIMMGFALPTLIISSVVLQRRVSKRRAILREIDDRRLCFDGRLGFRF